MSAHNNSVLDVSSHLVSIHTSKVFGRAAGGWQIVLPRRVVPGTGGLTYLDLIVPDDIVTIELDAGDGKGFELVMLGLVNRVARTLAQDTEGRPQRAIKVIGADMGKLLAKHDSGWSIALSDANYGPPDVKRMQMGVLDTGTAAKLVEGVFKGLFLRDVAEMAPYFVFESTTDDTWEQRNYAINLSSGPVWDVMKNCANEPYNTLYTETVPGEKPVFKVALTKTPIGDDGKLDSSLTTHEIGVTDVVAEDVGVCDDERVVYEIFQPHLSIIGADNTFRIWFVAPGLLNMDEAAVARHGAAMATFETNFVKVQLNPADPTDAGFLKEAEKRSRAFWARVKDNHKLESGSFTLHLNPRIRCGQRLLHTDYGNEYFIEQIDHQFVFSERPVALTSLSVTRGQSVEPTGSEPATEKLFFPDGSGGEA